MGWTSLTQAEVRSIKLYVTRGAAYADQVSLGFAIRLSQLGEELAEDHIVLRELDVLEGIASNSSTKAATQFEERSPFLCIRFGTSISPRPNRLAHPDSSAEAVCTVQREPATTFW